jgi:hypothetical protein
VPAGRAFLGATWSDRWNRAYAALSHDRQRAVDRVAMALIKGDVTPGMRVKPIEPSKHYREARINDGDRIIFRIEGGRVLFVDVVRHDDIGRYARMIPGLF